MAIVLRPSPSPRRRNKKPATSRTPSATRSADADLVQIRQKPAGRALGGQLSPRRCRARDNRQRTRSGAGREPARTANPSPGSPAGQRQPDRPASTCAINTTARRATRTRLSVTGSRNDANLTPVCSATNSTQTRSLAVSNPPSARAYGEPLQHNPIAPDRTPRPSPHRATPPTHSRPRPQRQPLPSKPPLHSCDEQRRFFNSSPTPAEALAAPRASPGGELRSDGVDSLGR